MAKQVIFSENAPAAIGPYSQAVRAGIAPATRTLICASGSRWLCAGDPHAYMCGRLSLALRFR